MEKPFHYPILFTMIVQGPGYNRTNPTVIRIHAIYYSKILVDIRLKPTTVMT